MSCPTCDHTMQRLDEWFWCPRCGTVKKTQDDYSTEAPKIVRRVVQYLFSQASYAERIFRREILECVFTPDERDGWRQTYARDDEK